MLTKINQDLGQLVQSLVKSIMLNRSGVSASGVPMGSDAYIKIFLADKVERFIADFPALNKLTDFKVYLNFVLSRSKATLPASCRMPSPICPSVCNLGHNNPKKPLG